MGLISNAGASVGPWSMWIVSYSDYTSTLCLFLGAGFLFVMPYHEFSHRTYFSENALLPGLVKGQFDEDVSAEIYLEGLRGEEERYPDAIPFPWLEAQLKQLGLEVYKHNFTLNYPFGTKQFHGQNLYAILRAPRSSSTEALVLSAPYRAPLSMESPTGVSIALLLASAKFFRNQNYWAKDIIFLITEHEQLGMQAWLEAYHQITCGTPGVLDHGELESRAGSIQAAVNLEFGKEMVTHINVKIQGLNGQLPNLDLFNLINRLCVKEGVGLLFEGREDFQQRGGSGWKEYFSSLSTLIKMMMGQASGVPAGNHGLFNRMGIEAVTLEGVDYNAVKSRELLSMSVRKRKSLKRHPDVDMHPMGRVIEGTFRSLNNLLERFHQSFFYYVLPGSWRYVSIGMYMPGFGLLTASLLISALSLWLRCLGQISFAEYKETKKRKESKTDDNDDKPLVEVMPLVPTPDVLGGALPLFLFYHTLGFLMLYLPTVACRTNVYFDLHNEDAITISIAMASLATAFFPFCRTGLTSISTSTFQMVKCLTLLEIALLAFSIALCNFSLAYFVTGFVVAPLALLSSRATQGKVVKKLLMSVLMMLGHPMILLLILCTVDSYRIGGDEAKLVTVLGNGLLATKHAMMFSITDGYVYGNVSYSLGCAFYLPCWSLLWAMAHAH